LLWKFSQSFDDLHKSVLRNVVGREIFAGIDTDILDFIAEATDIVFGLER